MTMLTSYPMTISFLDLEQHMIGYILSTFTDPNEDQAIQVVA